MGIPVVFLDRPPGELLADTVLLDNRGGARAACSRLLDDGHRRIGILLDSLSTSTRCGSGWPARRRRWPTPGSRFDEAAGPRRASATRTTRPRGRRDARPAGPADRVLLPEQPHHASARSRSCGAGAATPALVGFDDFELAHLMPRPFTVIAYDPRDWPGSPPTSCSGASPATSRGRRPRSADPAGRPRAAHRSVRDCVETTLSEDPITAGYRLSPAQAPAYRVSIRRRTAQPCRRSISLDRDGNEAETTIDNAATADDSGLK